MLALPEKCVRLARGPGRGDGSKRMASKVQYIQTDLHKFRSEKYRGSDGNGLLDAMCSLQIDIVTAAYRSSSSYIGDSVIQIQIQIALHFLIMSQHDLSSLLTLDRLKISLILFRDLNL